MAEKPVSGVRVALRRLWSLLCYICREIWAGFRSAPLWKQLIIPIVIVVGILLLFLTDVPPLIVVRHGVARLGRWFPFVFFLVLCSPHPVSYPSHIFHANIGDSLPTTAGISSVPWCHRAISSSSVCSYPLRVSWLGRRTPASSYVGCS